MVALSSTARAGAGSGPIASNKVVIGYFASWQLWSGERVDALPVDGLTHLVYAFGIISANGLAKLEDPCVDIGDCRSGPPPGGPGGAFARLADLKRHHPRLRLLIALGGWDGSKYFSYAARDTQSRKQFADSVIRVFFSRHPRLFDGVDIDWEYPVTEGAPGNLRSPQDGEHLTLLMREMRRRLDRLSISTGQHFGLSLEIPADRDNAMHFDLRSLSHVVDRIGLMSYDYHDGESVTGFNAPLYASAKSPTPEMNVDASVRMVLAAGVPADKIVLGLPFYGRAYADVMATHDGLFQRSAPHPPAAWGGEDGIDYRDLVAKRPTRNGFVLRWDADAHVPWLYNRQTRIWISYDNARSIAAKSRYARAHGLAGVMIWHVGADDGTLLPAALQGLGKAASR